MSLYTYSTSYTRKAILFAVMLFFLQGLPAKAQQTAILAYVTQHSKEIVHDLQSPALSDAVMHLVESRRLEVAYAPELLEGQTSDCQRLPNDDQKAMECVLASSGLSAKKHQNGVYVIHKPEKEKKAEKGRIIGSVRNAETGTILTRAHIMVKGTPHSTTSDPQGAFHINHVSPGVYDVQVSMMGYEKMEFSGVEVQPGQDSEIDLKMMETTLPLDEVLITDRKRRGLSLPDSLDPLSYQGFQLGRVRGGLFMSASPSKVEGVQFGGLGSMARDSLRGVQFSGVFNSAESVKGAQFGGIFNTVTGDLNGSQFSGVLNQLGGNLQGGQYAGTFNKAGHVGGVQFAGVANLADGNVRGLQAAGIVNVSGNKQGAQLAGIANRAFEQRGFQGAGIMNYAVKMQGMQAGGVINVSANDARGMQASGILNAVARDIQGVQAAGIVNFAGGRFQGAQFSGILNVAGHVDRGVQVGLVNLSKTNNGVPIGLFSFVQETGLRLDTWVDERGFVVSAARTGNRKFSNYLGVGGPTDDIDNGAIILGLGGEFAHGQRLYSTIDGLYYAMGLEDSDFDEHMAQIRLSVGFKVIPYLAVFGGPSLNLLLSNNPDSTIPLPNRVIDRGEWGSTDYRFWAGFTVGLRLSTNRLYPANQ
ncbi:MAG: carboxypeptidase-like regulatory domain-containing protein [Rhodothermaceae bacterium]|nr:carboxypeptidase-like regulatory domain-containing protein [Rhodothermaceae bacterium]